MQDDLGGFNAYDAHYAMDGDGGAAGFDNLAWVDSAGRPPRDWLCCIQSHVRMAVRAGADNRAMYWNDADLMYGHSDDEDYM